MGAWGSRGMWWSDRGGFSLPPIATLRVDDIYPAAVAGANINVHADNFILSDFLTVGAGASVGGQLEAIIGAFSGRVDAEQVNSPLIQTGDPFGTTPTGGERFVINGCAVRVIASGTTTINTGTNTKIATVTTEAGETVLGLIKPTANAAITWGVEAASFVNYLKANLLDVDVKIQNATGTNRDYDWVILGIKKA